MTATTTVTTPTPSLSAPSRVAPTSLRQAWVPLFALALAFFVEMVDNTILTNALPTIGRDLGVGTTALQWVTGAYSLTFGGLLLTAGSIADRFGRKRVLLYGVAGFGVLSALVAVVSTGGQLIALRAALGVAAAAMAPVTASLVFRLFDDEALRMRAMTMMVVIGMSGFAFGPIVAGSMLAHYPWQWLLLLNVPVALFSWLGVRWGVPADDAADLHRAPLDVAGAALSVVAIALGCFTLTSAVEHGWTSVLTLASAAGAVAAVTGFILRERTATHPMLELALLRGRTVRGAALAQLGGSVAMVGTIFGLVLHFQYAYGWSPMHAGLANLPFVLTMLAATPLAEQGATRLGHRVTTMVGAIVLTGSLVAMAWSVGHGYLPIAISMVGMTLGLRVIMTVCAIALIDALPQNRTSMGAALNDTAQELGTSVGVAVVGTVLAAVVGSALPDGAWSSQLVARFFTGESIAYLGLAALVGAISIYGAATLTDSRSVEEAH